MEVNVLDYTIEEVLSMEYEDGKWRPVAFLSKSLNKTERNYEIHDKEILVVIRKLENQRHLLEDTKFRFKIWMDYKNLEYFIKAQKLNRKQAHWALYLLRFDFTLKHVPEAKIEKAGRLSRRPDQKIVTENNSDNQILIKNQQIHSLDKVVIEELEVEILKKIKIARSKNEEVVKVVEEIKRARVKVL